MANDDLISRRALLRDMGLENAVKYGNQTTEQQHNSYSTLMKYEIADYIQDAPAEDAELIVHAYWKEVNQKGWMPWGYLITPELTCSNCGEEAVNYSVSYSEQGGSVRSWSWIKTRRCPWCGAYMDAKETEDG